MILSLLFKRLFYLFYNNYKCFKHLKEQQYLFIFIFKGNNKMKYNIKIQTFILQNWTKQPEEPSKKA